MLTAPRRPPFSELLPDGRSVYQATRDAALFGGGDDTDPTGETRPRRVLPPDASGATRERGQPMSDTSWVAGISGERNYRRVSDPQPSGIPPWGGGQAAGMPQQSPPMWGLNSGGARVTDAELPVSAQLGAANRAYDAGVPTDTDEQLGAKLPGTDAYPLPTPEFGPNDRFGRLHTTPQGQRIGSTGEGRLGHLRALEEADPASPITETESGWQIAPQKHLSRKRQLLLGLLQEAIAGGQGPTEGTAWRALGGAGAGGATGAVNPRLIKALSRSQQADEIRTDEMKDLGIDTAQANIGNVQAQAEYHRMQPYIEQLKLSEAERRHQDDIAAAKERNAATNATRLKVAETNRTSRAPRVPVTINGRTYDVSSDTAARMAQREQESGNKEALLAVIEEESEHNALDRRRVTDEQVSAKQQELYKLTNNPDGTPNMGSQVQNTVRINELQREIADLQRESDNQQRIAETSAANKRKAEAGARSAGVTPQWKYGQSQSQPQQGGSAPRGRSRRTAGGQTGGGGAQGQSRAKFRQQNPQYRTADDSTIDKLITGAGYTPIP